MLYEYSFISDINWQTNVGCWTLNLHVYFYVKFNCFKHVLRVVWDERWRCYRHAIWEGTNIRSDRSHKGIGFISFLEAGYKVTGTPYKVTKSKSSNLPIKGSIMHIHHLVATKCYHGGRRLFSVAIGEYQETSSCLDWTWWLSVLLNRRGLPGNRHETPWERR